MDDLTKTQLLEQAEMIRADAEAHRRNGRDELADSLSVQAQHMEETAAGMPDDPTPAGMVNPFVDASVLDGFVQAYEDRLTQLESRIHALEDHRDETSRRFTQVDVDLGDVRDAVVDVQVEVGLVTPDDEDAPEPVAPDAGFGPDPAEAAPGAPSPAGQTPISNDYTEGAAVPPVVPEPVASQQTRDGEDVGAGDGDGSGVSESAPVTGEPAPDPSVLQGAVEVVDPPVPPVQEPNAIPVDDTGTVEAPVGDEGAAESGSVDAQPGVPSPAASEQPAVVELSPAEVDAAIANVDPDAAPSV